MSYEIYFISKKDLSSDNVDSILEIKAKPSDEFYISKEKIELIKNALSSKGLKFEISQNIKLNTTDINFSNYQIEIYDNSIVMIVPYWDENSNDQVMKEIKTITNAFLDLGFKIYDPQTGEVSEKKFDMTKSYSESKSIVDKGLNQPNSNNSLIIIPIVLVILVIVFFVIKKIIR